MLIYRLLFFCSQKYEFVPEGYGLNNLFAEVVLSQGLKPPARLGRYNLEDKSPRL